MLSTLSLLQNAAVQLGLLRAGLEMYFSHISALASAVALAHPSQQAAAAARNPAPHAH